MLPFRFSTPVPPAEVRASGTLTLLPLRTNSMEDISSKANRDLKEEWTVAYGKLPVGAACESPHGHLAPFALPECWRKEYLADADRDGDKTKGTLARHSMIDDLTGGMNTTPTFPNESESLERRMMSRLLVLDGAGASDLLHEWQRYATYSAESFTKEFPTLEDYISHRFYDAGLVLYYAVSGFAVGCLPLTPAETSLAAPLIDSLGRACALTNDYYSWNKEFAAHAAAGGHGRVYNCVTWMMEAYNCDVGRAKELLKDRIHEYERQFEKMWRDWEENGVRGAEEGGVDVERLLGYVQAAMFATSGSAYWHARAPRYNAGEWVKARGA